MALQGRGRRRYNPFTDSGLSSDEIDKLLRKELGAKRIPDDDNTRIQRWSPTLEEIRERQEAMGLFSKLEGKIDLDTIPINPFEYPDGVYPVRFDGATLRPITGQKEAEEALDLKYIIVDDFVCSGDTARRIHKGIKEFAPDAKCLGVLSVLELEGVGAFQDRTELEHVRDVTWSNEDHPDY